MWVIEMQKLVTYTVSAWLDLRVDGPASLHAGPLPSLNLLSKTWHREQMLEGDSSCTHDLGRQRRGGD
ncbi:unnamed protein product [Calypogeia fissa]